MSLALISQSYLVGSDSEFGGDGDEFEEGKFSKSSESKVKSFSKLDYDDDEVTEPKEKSCTSPPDKELEWRLLNILNMKQPSRPGSVSQLEKLIKPETCIRNHQNKNGDVGEPRIEVEKLYYRCPYCIVTYSLANDLIQHLPTHTMKNSTVPKTENFDSSKTIAKGQTRKNLQNPKPSRKVPPPMSPKNSRIKLPKEAHSIRRCELVLTRCDLMILEGKLLTKNKEIVSTFHFNVNDLTEIRGNTNRKITGINARRTMLKIQMQEEGDSENEEHIESPDTDSQLTMSQLKNDCGPNQPFYKSRSSKSRHHLAVQENCPRLIEKLAKHQYMCPTCFKTISTSRHLKRHIRTHTGEKPYKCTICSKGFTHWINLKNHTRTHTGEKPYKCPTCFKTFSVSTHLKRHTRTHTGEKPYKCSICPKGFAQSTNLKIHIRTHTGHKSHKCPFCSKGFAYFKLLQYHIRIHTGEKPYTCPNCSKEFRKSDHLKRHTRTHTGEKSSK